MEYIFGLGPAKKSLEGLCINLGQRISHNEKRNEKIIEITQSQAGFSGCKAV